MNQETKRPIALEDILRLKRAERPPAEFWATFDRELRAKQLAALVEKRPWWRTLPRPLFGFSRYHLSLGAAAIVAIAFVATREHRPAVNAPNVEQAAAVVADNASVPASVPSLVTGESVVSSPAPVALVAVSESPAAESFVSAETSSPGEVTRLIAGIESARPDTLSARTLNEHFKVAQAAEPAVARGLFGATNGFETRALPARATIVEPLAQMTNPAALRKAKFDSVASLISSPSDTSATRTSDRAAGKLLSTQGGERLYDSVSRIKAKANQLDWRL